VVAGGPSRRSPSTNSALLVGPSKAEPGLGHRGNGSGALDENRRQLAPTIQFAGSAASLTIWKGSPGKRPGLLRRPAIVSASRDRAAEGRAFRSPQLVMIEVGRSHRRFQWWVSGCRGHFLLRTAFDGRTVGRCLEGPVLDRGRLPGGGVGSPRKNQLGGVDDEVARPPSAQRANRGSGFSRNLKGHPSRTDAIRRALTGFPRLRIRDPGVSWDERASSPRRSRRGRFLRGPPGRARRASRPRR